MDLSSSPLNMKNIVGVEQSLTGKTTIRKFFFLLMLKEINQCNNKVCVCECDVWKKRQGAAPWIPVTWSTRIREVMMRPYWEKSCSSSFWVMVLGRPLTYKLASRMEAELGRAYDTCGERVGEKEKKRERDLSWVARTPEVLNVLGSLNSKQD